MPLYKPLRSPLVGLRVKNRIATISNRFLYNNLPPLTPGQVQTLIQQPERTDELLRKFGPQITQAMLSRKGAPAPGLGTSETDAEKPQAKEEPPTVTPEQGPERRYTRCVFLASLELNKQSDDELVKARDEIVSILNHRLPTVGLVVEFPDQVEDLMRPFNPDDTIVINWADSVGDFPHGGLHVAQSLATLGFDDAGSSPLTQEIMNDRNASFRFLKDMEIDVPAWRMVSTPGEARYWKHGWPALVRPNSEHGSLGLRQCKDEKDAAKQIEELLDDNFEPPLILIEKIDGREFSVGAWSDGETWEVFPLAEANFEGSSDDVKDEKDKQSSSAKASEQNTIPAKVSDAFSRKIGAIAVECLSRFGVNIWGRVDFRMKPGSRTPIVIDVNAEPDISRDTLMTEMAKAAGLSYEEMILGILDRAVKKYERKYSKAKEGEAEVKPMSTGGEAVK